MKVVLAGGIYSVNTYSDNACTTNTTNEIAPIDFGAGYCNLDYYGEVCTKVSNDGITTHGVGNADGGVASNNRWVKFSAASLVYGPFSVYTAAGCATKVKDTAIIGTWDACVISNYNPPTSYKYSCTTGTGAAKKIYYNSTDCDSGSLLGETAIVTGSACTTTTDGIGGATIYLKAASWLCGTAPSTTSTAGATSTNGTSATNGTSSTTGAATTGSALVNGATKLCWSWAIFPLGALLAFLTTH